MSEQTQSWLAIYHHRFGEDYALFSHEPTEEEMHKYFVDYEPERGLDNEDGPQDEYFESCQVWSAE
jgi:hypothetical protein